MGLKIVEVLALEPKTQVAGVTIICDGKGYGMKQFAGMSVADVKLMMMSMEVSLGSIQGDTSGCSPGFVDTMYKECKSCVYSREIDNAGLVPSAK